MTVRIQLVKDKKVLFEIPLSALEPSRENVQSEIAALEEQMDEAAKLFDALSHETRLKMMKLLIEDEDFTLGFADFMRNLNLNPKLVWENTQKLQDSGLLRKSDDGKYQCSELGKASFLMLSLAFRQLIQTVRELEEIGGET